MFSKRDARITDDDCYVRDQEKRLRAPYEYLTAFVAPPICPRDTDTECKQLHVGGLQIQQENHLRGSYVRTPLALQEIRSDYRAPARLFGGVAADSSADWSSLREPCLEQQRSRLVLPTHWDFNECQNAVDPARAINTRRL